MHPEIQLELFPASHGDALLLRCVHGERATNVLIDGGPRGTYETSIRPRLRELSSHGQKLDLVVVTHTDADHVEGVLSLLEENGDAASPKVIPISDCWHNSYRHLDLQGREPTPDEIARVERQIGDPGLRDAAGPISAKQGTTLAGLLRRGGYSWNAAFANAAVMAPGVAQIGTDVRVTVLSPGPNQLRRLAQFWRRELLAFGVTRDAVSHAAFEEAYERRLLRHVQAEDESSVISSSASLEPPSPEAQVEDSSVTNASSIALLVEFHDQTALLLGDALPSVVAAGLQGAGAPTPLDVDWVKVAHHGSHRNISHELCERVRGRGFLVSTDGTRHHHPDAEALLLILATQAPGLKLFFNYETATARFIGSAEAVARYGHEVQFITNSQALGRANLGAK